MNTGGYCYGGLTRLNMLDTVSVNSGLLRGIFDEIKLPQIVVRSKNGAEAPFQTVNKI